MTRINQRYWIDNDAIKKYDEKQDGIHCVMCGSKLEGRQRKYCSWDCEYDYKSIKYKWESQQQNRRKAFKRDNNICKMCNTKFSDEQLIADHIIPIALGGEEFDLDNIQTLCIECNKTKTKDDMIKIVDNRRLNRVLDKNKQLDIN